MTVTQCGHSSTDIQTEIQINVIKDVKIMVSCIINQIMLMKRGLAQQK